MTQNVFLQYLIWQFFDVPKEILKAWKNFLSFNLSYFSVSFLARTLFSPWRKYKWSYGRGFSIGRYFEVFFSNLISRFLGAIIRSFLIIIGIIAEIFIIVTGLISLIIWFILPALLLLGFIFGITFIV